MSHSDWTKSTWWTSLVDQWHTAIVLRRSGYTLEARMDRALSISSMARPSLERWATSRVGNKSDCRVPGAADIHQPIDLLRSISTYIMYLHAKCRDSRPWSSTAGVGWKQNSPWHRSKILCFYTSTEHAFHELFNMVCITVCTLLDNIL